MAGARQKWITRLPRFCVPSPPDAKLAGFNRDNEVKISHRVGKDQLHERRLAVALPVCYGVAEKAQWRFDLGEAASRPTGPAGLAP